jgi:radical SAM protein (TIGR01212 family)
MTDPAQNTIPWNDYSSYVKRNFGVRVQKISVDAGFTCPNRDGKISSHACIYCTNESFSPFYCSPQLSVTEQLEKGIAFFSPKYKTQRYLAYFQSYTNTYDTIEKLRALYTEALSVSGVEGLVIATRPDCINKDILLMLKDVCNGRYLSVEYGAESTNDATLDFINRGHSWQQTVDAVILTNSLGINCGLHLIIGLPDENEEDFYNHARKISKLPIQTLKIHQMQVLKGTGLEMIYKTLPGLFYDLNIENYTKIIINFLELLNPEIVVERFTSESPKNILIYPDWKGKKNFEISHIVANTMNAIGAYQGKLYKSE